MAVAAGYVLGLALRWGWWLGVRLAVVYATAQLWPCVLVAYGLRAGALPPLRARFGRAPELLLGCLALGVAVLLLVVPAVKLEAVARAYLAAFPLVGAPWRAQRELLPGAGPAVVAVGLLLAGAWPWLARLPVLRSLSVVRGAGDRAAAPGGGGRTTDHGQRPGRLVVRPESAQRVATADFDEDDWFCEHVHGRGLLTMLVAPAGVGKTDLVNGTLASAELGEAFAGRLLTRKPRRVLVLSEMSPRTMRSGLRRWGFFTEPTGRLHALRLRLGGGGAYLDVLWASKLLGARADGARAQWHEVVHAIKPKLKRGGYDLLVVDSLGRWLGNDSSNTQMLAALGLLRELIDELGIGVLVLHHCGKDEKAPYRPRGGTAIEGECDAIWSLARLEGVTDLRDGRRVLECVKSRDAEHCPPRLLIERVLGDPWVGRPYFRLAGDGESAEPPRPVVVEVSGSGGPGAGVWVPPPPVLLPVLPPPPPDPTDGLPEREAAVLAAVLRRAEAGATARSLADGPLLHWGPRAYKAICEALTRLERLGLVRQAGEEAPPKGGPKTRVFVASCVADPADAVATAERILRTARKRQ